MGELLEAAKGAILGTVVPFFTSTLVTWLVSAHVLSLLSINPTSAAKTITGALVWVVTFAFTHLVQHHERKGTYK